MEQFVISLFEEIHKTIDIFILRIFNSQFAPLHQQNAQYFPLEIYITVSHSIFLCFDPQRIIIREPNQNGAVKTKLGTSIHSLHAVEGSYN